MTSPIEGISTMGARPPSMNTHFDNPASTIEAGDQMSLSDMAKAALSNIGSLQSDFQAKVTPSAESQSSIQSLTDKAGATDRVDPDHVSDAVKILAEQVETSAQVQTQLARFVMASSMSSSLGRNLNMFLRGQ